LKKYGHKPGTPNPIMAQEESAILLGVERAKSSSDNSHMEGIRVEHQHITNITKGPVAFAKDVKSNRVWRN